MARGLKTNQHTNRINMKQTIILFTLVFLMLSALNTSAQTSRRKIIKHSYHNQNNTHKRKPSNTNTFRKKNEEKTNVKSEDDIKKENQAAEMFFKAKHLYKTDHREEAEELFKNYLQTGYEHYSALSKYYLGKILLTKSAVDEISYGHDLFEDASAELYEQAINYINENNAFDAIDNLKIVIDMHHSPYVAWAGLRLGLLYFYGQGVGEDKVTAFSYFMLASQAGSKSAMWFLGECYKNGWGTKRDLSLSNQWIKESGYTFTPTLDFPTIYGTGEEYKEDQDINEKFRGGYYTYCFPERSPYSCYAGEMLYGKAHGRGILLKNDGSYQMGIWNKGELSALYNPDGTIKQETQTTSSKTNNAATKVTVAPEIIQIISQIDDEYPMEIGEGMTITGVKVHEEYVLYSVEVDENLFSMEERDVNTNKAKKEILKFIKSDSNAKSLLKILKKNNVGIMYRYIGNNSGKSYTVKLEPGEL